jgi:hypothetical protein
MASEREGARKSTGQKKGCYMRADALKRERYVQVYIIWVRIKRSERSDYCEHDEETLGSSSFWLL